MDSVWIGLSGNFLNQESASVGKTTPAPSARSLMLNNGLDAASAALEVGYEGATQFNRQYSRFFGQPPMRDIRALLSPGAPKLELVGSLLNQR
jgi:hypothetical protein